MASDFTEWARMMTPPYIEQLLREPGGSCEPLTPAPQELKLTIETDGTSTGTSITDSIGRTLLGVEHLDLNLSIGMNGEPQVQVTLRLDRCNVVFKGEFDTLNPEKLQFTKPHQAVPKPPLGKPKIYGRTADLFVLDEISGETMPAAPNPLLTREQVDHFMQLYHTPETNPGLNVRYIREENTHG